MWQANIFDFTAWSNKFTGVVRGNYSISSDSITITATSNDAYTQTSGYSYVDYRIPVTAGFKYRLTWSASNNNNGRIMVFANGQASSNMMFTANNATVKELIFTVPSGTTYITMRVGVVNSGDSITYSNIKFQEEATWYIDTSGELNNINFIELPDSSMSKPYPHALWRINANVEDGFPYNLIFLDIIEAINYPPVFIGNKRIKEIFYGSKPIKFIYYGKQKIY